MSDMISRKAALALPYRLSPSLDAADGYYVSVDAIAALPSVGVTEPPPLKIVTAPSNSPQFGWVLDLSKGVVSFTDDQCTFGYPMEAGLRAWAMDVQPAPAPSLDVAALSDPDGHFGDFIKSAIAEAEKAMHKFPQPNYVISKVAEEAGEVVKAAIHCAERRETAENVRGEMRQLVAMLYRLWVEGDQVHGLPPVSAALARKGGDA